MSLLHLLYVILLAEIVRHGGGALSRLSPSFRVVRIEENESSPSILRDTTKRSESCRPTDVTAGSRERTPLPTAQRAILARKVQQG